MSWSTSDRPVLVDSTLVYSDAVPAPDAAPPCCDPEAELLDDSLRLPEAATLFLTGGGVLGLQVCRCRSLD